MAGPCVVELDVMFVLVPLDRIEESVSWLMNSKEQNIAVSMTMSHSYLVGVRVGLNKSVKEW